MDKSINIAVLWLNAPAKGRLNIHHGSITRAMVKEGKGEATTNSFFFCERTPARLELTIENAILGRGAPATRVSVLTEENPLTFFLRDVNVDWPIWVPQYGIVVTQANDKRNAREIVKVIKERNLSSTIESYANEPEANFEDAAENTRNLICQTWLGLGRDMRNFSCTYDPKYSSILSFVPMNHGFPALSQECIDGKEMNYQITMGRGEGCNVDVIRHLDQGTLPILHRILRDEDITYSSTMFVTSEKSSLTINTVRGTHYLVADKHARGHMLNKEQESKYESLVESETTNRDETTVMCLRTEITNTGLTPRYCYLSALKPQKSKPCSYIAKTGMTTFDSDTVCGIQKLDGKTLPQREMSFLLQPGEKAVYECFVPHTPVSSERAEQIAHFNFEKKLTEARVYWQQKLARGAAISVPEKRIDEMIKAGLLHLDIVAYGLEPRGPLAPTIGVYSPIGSESSPIIQFFDAMGWHDIARRSLDYFLEKQHDNGFIQNFGGYMLETGGVLWTLGQHYRLTRDDAWVGRIKEHLLKACNFQIAWRRESMKEEQRGRGYGMIKGKVADPEDHFHQFMLNAMGCGGLQRAGEMLQNIAPEESQRLLDEAQAWKKDIRDSLFYSTARSPVVPLDDGTWAPSTPPWPEVDGLSAIYVDGESFQSHQTISTRDTLIGPLYLIYHEIIDAKEPIGEFITRTHQAMFMKSNTAFSQPYYARHDWAQLMRGEVESYLKTYYYSFSGLADRETYTFWEHYFGASPHKTHEEAWFLMQTRWMLWFENGDTLNLLSAIPRKWLENGKVIELREVASNFGHISLSVKSLLQENHIEANITFHDKHLVPKTVRLRLPHPEKIQPNNVVGGQYESDTETVTVIKVEPKMTIKIFF